MSDIETEARRFGKFVLLELLGKGANAHVYRAVQSGAMGFRKEVAVKQVLPHVSNNERMVKGLINEARIAGYLRHRNVVEIYEFDKVGDTFYLAMEYVPGFPLSDILDRSRARRDPLPTRIVAAMVVQMCEGLDCAHGVNDETGKPLGMVHRDIKPGNVMLTFGGVVKVMDFGVVKAASNLFHTSSANVTKGTPIYMSPEQVRGDTLDRRSDVFSLGSVVSEMITGRTLFMDEVLMDVLHKVDRADIDEMLRQVQGRFPEMVPILRLAMQRSPDDRFPTALEMGRAVRRAVGDLPEDEEVGQWLMAFMDARPRPILAVLPDPELFADDPLVSQMVTFQDLGDLLEDEEYDGPRAGEPEPLGAQLAEQQLEADTDLRDPLGDVDDTLPPPGGGGRAQGDTVGASAQAVAVPPEVVRFGRGVEMVRIEPGEFWMGSPDVEVGRNHDEALHRVCVEQPFLLGITPVTQETWEATMGDNPSWTMASDHPVESVSWYQAVALCNRLSELEGLPSVYRIDGDDVSWDRGMDGFRLPTEAEWELAARAGQNTRYAGGDRADEVAWHWRNTGGLTHPVKELRANGYGLYDVSGNVSEWVWDWYGPYPSGDVVSNPHGPLYGENRIHRGGSAFNLPADVRVARRHADERPVDRFNFLGLRIARSLPDAS